MPRVSKLAKLPPPLREWLHKAFIEHAFGDIVPITAALNEQLVACGLHPVGKTAVGEESLRVKRAQEAIAAATRQMQLMADSSRDDSDKRGEALNALVAEGMFEALLTAREAEAEPDPAKRIGLMNKAALASARLTTSSVRQRRWRHEVEERAKAAADAVTKIAKKGGMSADQVREIRAQILGVASTRAPMGAPQPSTAGAAA